MITFNNIKHSNTTCSCSSTSYNCHDDNIAPHVCTLLCLVVRTTVCHMLKEKGDNSGNRKQNVMGDFPLNVMGDLPL